MFSFPWQNFFPPYISQVLIVWGLFWFCLVSFPNSFPALPSVWEKSRITPKWLLSYLNIIMTAFCTSFCLMCPSLYFSEEPLFLFAPGRKQTLQDAKLPEGSFSADAVIIWMVCHPWMACDFIYFAFSQQKQQPLIPCHAPAFLPVQSYIQTCHQTTLQWMSCVRTNSGSDLVKLTFRSRHQ